ncbi:hypothetical protein D3872_14765 [Massilia cavernae]|uniref:Uncharacterized protein n=1 Tax=Massilia cavernae TaxID=2320864 RepID=A0A418XRJ3_9BURK|nr:hypothetical protein D3872_14765 [Massilia cavernae]
METRFDAILPTLATKGDLAELRGATKADLAELRGEMALGFERNRADMAALSEKLHLDMNDSSSKLHQEMNKMFQRLLLWMIGIWLTSSLAIFGGTLAIMDTMLDGLRDDIRQVKAAVVSDARQAPAAVPAQAPLSTGPG